MKAAGTQLWDLNQLLSTPGVITELPLHDIETNQSMRADYEFTNQEILAEANRINRIGFTQRLVVERIADKYILIGPLLPYLAIQSSGITSVSCIVRSGDIAQVQDVLSIQLNSAYSTLSPLVYARLIRRLYRIFPVIKSVSGMSPGIKREWAATILGISSSAVLRYSYISHAPAALQLRCNNPQFPYLCLRQTQHFTQAQYHMLLDDLIHYELRSRYQTITASEFNEMIRNASESSISKDAHDDPSNIVDASNGGILDPNEGNLTSSQSSINHPLPVRSNAQMPALFDDLTESYYRNLRDSYEDRFDEESAADNGSEMMQIARKDGYIVPDQTLREVSYQLYCLTQMRITSGQKLLDYACLRSILDSINQIYNEI